MVIQYFGLETLADVWIHKGVLLLGLLEGDADGGQEAFEGFHAWFLSNFESGDTVVRVGDAIKQSPVSQQSHLQLLLDGDSTHILSFSREFTRNQVEEILIFIVDPLTHSFLHLIIELDRVQAVNLIISLADLFIMLCDCTFLMQLDISQANNPPPQHIFVGPIQLLGKVVEDGAGTLTIEVPMSIVLIKFVARLTYDFLILSFFIGRLLFGFLGRVLTTFRLRFILTFRSIILVLLFVLQLFQLGLGLLHI